MKDKLIKKSDLKNIAVDGVKADKAILDAAYEQITKELIVARKAGKDSTRIKITKWKPTSLELTNSLIDQGYNVAEQLVGTDRFLVIDW
jgi:hypothetical protein